MFDDDEVVTHNAERADEFIAYAMQADLRQKLIELAGRHRPGGGGAVRKLHRAVRGSYNINWRVEFEDGGSVMFHVPLPGSVAFPEEKVRAEVATMRLVRARTSIPVPEVYHWGAAADNPAGTGPFIIMEYVEHESCLADMIRDMTDDTDSHGLARDMPEGRLLKAYRHMANIVLQLSAIEGDAIGYPTLLVDEEGNNGSPSPSPSSSPSWRVTTRPVSHNMNELVASGGLPPGLLPAGDRTFKAEKDWTSALADMHLAHLAFQRNDAVLGPPDARDKYVARQLFRRLAASGRLTGDENRSGAGGAGRDGEEVSEEEDEQREERFKLWCDDMRPASVLLDGDENVVGVIDWEMSYFAPASYAYDPPWWLCLAKPEYWRPGLGDFFVGFERYLGVFLRAMEMEEEEVALRERARAAGCSALDRLCVGAADLRLDDTGVPARRSSPPLSVRMRRSWEGGRFFVNYAARKAWAFDPIYWKYIDPKYFGENVEGGYEGRLKLLSEREKEQMELFVERKVEESKEVKLVEWDPEDARVLLQACLEGDLGQGAIPEPREIRW
ncbi:hypothetical protein VPNG_05938 [Cytospora leucostoma]|uniref:Uncharacterized protein n=1 Tax=Cytospora leucostoma TaxID=1230097 RepID=A0A423XAZ8_9PEZI|nr:hypothetical protein VPNG_05938 [Cytospora leucostoma]